MSVFANTLCSVVRLLDSNMALLYSNKCWHAFIIWESLSCNCLWNKKKNPQTYIFLWSHLCPCGYYIMRSLPIGTCLWHANNAFMIFFELIQIHDHDGYYFFKLAIAVGNLVLGTLSQRLIIASCWCMYYCEMCYIKWQIHWPFLKDHSILLFTSNNSNDTTHFFF